MNHYLLFTISTSSQKHDGELDVKYCVSVPQWMCNYVKVLQELNGNVVDHFPTIVDFFISYQHHKFEMMRDLSLCDETKRAKMQKNEILFEGTTDHIPNGYVMILDWKNEGPPNGCVSVKQKGILLCPGPAMKLDNGSLLLEIEDVPLSFVYFIDLATLFKCSLDDVLPFYQPYMFRRLVKVDPVHTEISSYVGDYHAVYHHANYDFCFRLDFSEFQQMTVNKKVNYLRPQKYPQFVKSVLTLLFYCLKSRGCKVPRDMKMYLAGMFITDYFLLGKKIMCE
jgi:hypothetical protein